MLDLGHELLSLLGVPAYLPMSVLGLGLLVVMLRGGYD
jgi:hypothetical protein